MTDIQVKYWDLKEKERSNLAQEAEASRSHRAQESLTAQANTEQARHNRRTEELTASDLAEKARHNLVGEQLTLLSHKETVRSNKAREQETHRANVANETETRRSNLAREFETKRSNLAKEAETRRANMVKEDETSRHNIRMEYYENIKTSASRAQAESTARLNSAKANRQEMENELYKEFGRVNEEINVASGVGKTAKTYIDAIPLLGFLNGLGG